jgi:hypothetical protein
MTRIRRGACARLIAACALIFAACSGIQAHADDKYVGSNVDVRTLLYYKVAPTALAELVPPGWELSQVASGPSAGANVQVTFADQLATANAAGAAGASVRYVLFSMLVKKAGAETANLMIFTGLSPSGAGPYGTNAKASETVSRSVSYSSGKARVAESWDFRADTGESVLLDLQFDRGTLAIERSESRVYSQVKPQFSRIYRAEQGVDVVKEGLRHLSLRARGGKLSRIFDGSEQLVSISSLPWYSRQIYLPAP